MTKRSKRQKSTGVNRRGSGLRLLLLLPLVTLVFFLALAALSFFEVEPNEAPQREARSPGEVSAEQLARYRDEAERFEEIRREKQANLSARKILEGIREAEEESEIPRLGTAIRDFRVVCERSPREAEVVLRGTLELLLDAVHRDEIWEKEVELLTRLLTQSTLLVRGEFELSGEERKQAFALLEVKGLESAEAKTSLLRLLARSCHEADVDRLTKVLQASRSPQVRSEITRAIASLES